MSLFCAAIRKDSVFRQWLPLLSNILVLSFSISLVCHLKCPYVFLPIFSGYYCFIDACVVFIVSSRCTVFFWVLCSLRVFESMHRRYLELFSFSISICWNSPQVLFKNCQEYLTMMTAQFLSLWWNSCYIVWYPVVSSFSWDTLF